MNQNHGPQMLEFSDWVMILKYHKLFKIMFENIKLFNLDQAVNISFKYPRLVLPRLVLPEFQSFVWSFVICALGTHTCDIFSFLYDWSAHLERYIFLKTPLESVQFQRGGVSLKMNGYTSTFTKSVEKGCFLLIPRHLRLLQKGYGF